MFEYEQRVRKELLGGGLGEWVFRRRGMREILGVKL